MDRTASHSEEQPHQPRLHVLPRQHSPDDDAPPFFVRFSHDGKTLELLTPATRECYRAAATRTG